MDFPLPVVLIGLLVGGLVGFTGLGGGVLLLPLLILGLRVPPIVAVGSGTAFSILTKISAALLHWRWGNVDFRLVGTMALGSVPGAVAGVSFLGWVRFRYGESVNDLLALLIGALLILIPLLMLAQNHIEKRGGLSLRDRLPSWVKWYHGALFAGVVGGFLVGATSVGSGSVIMMLLLLFYRRTPAVLVGTDIFHAVILTGVAGLSHFQLGTVDMRLVLWLVVGSVPGVLVGSKLTTIVPGGWLRHVLLVVLFVSGILMLRL